MMRIRLIRTAVVLLTSIAVALGGELSAQEAQNAFERAPLLKEPTTPEEMFAAAVLMVDLIRTDLAAKYLEQFEAAAPDDAILLRLRDKFGTADFLKLAQTKELQPRSTLLLERLNAAAKRQAEDPEFADELVRRLTRGDAQRETAMLELRNAGVRVVPRMLKQMATQEMAAHHDTIEIALTKMGNQVIPPLIGALDSPNLTIRGAVIDALGWLDAKVAVPYLWFPAFDESEPDGIRVAARKTLAKLLKGSPDRVEQLSSVDASNELIRLARLYFRNPNAQPVTAEGLVDLWSWSDREGTVVEEFLPLDTAALMISSRFARQALALSPDAPEPQRQYLASILGLEVLRNGWDQPRIVAPESAMYLALTAGEEMVSQVLSEALEAAQPSTALAALEVLSQIGSRDQLAPQKGYKTPVLAALNSPDSRVQFAAATTILKLDPKHGFNGASRVVSILSRAVSDDGASRAVVIDSDPARATAVAGFLFDGGYEGIVTTTGREGFERAANLAGVELIVVHVNCQRWDLTPTLANLRADARTAAIPVIIFGPAALTRELSRLVARSAPAIYVVEAASSADYLDQLRSFTRHHKTPPLSAQERAMEKNVAIYWLSVISSGNLARIFDITPAETNLSAAVEDPAVSLGAVAALSGIPTKTAQRRLTEIAMSPQMNEIIREAAANQLAFHIQRHGLLLTKDVVEDFVSTWKSTDNARVKTALASVIGSFRPSAEVVRERLRGFAVPTTN